MPRVLGRARVPRVAAAVAIAAGAALALAAGHTASASIVPTVGLATAGSYSVLAATTVTNTGPSVLGQSVGLSPGTAVDGFPPGIVLAPATIQAANPVALQAQDDLTIAYDDAAGRGVEFSHPNPDLVGQTLLPGVHAATAMAPLGLSGELVLDGQGDEDAVFIFRTDSTLITSTGSTITLINGASECNVFWQVGSSATLASGSFFVGTILALTSVTVESGTVVHGRALARTGAVTLDNNVFTQPSCQATAITPTTTTTATPTTVAEVTTTLAPAATTTPGPIATAPGPIATTPPTPVATAAPTTPSEQPTLTVPATTTTFPFNVTDITLPSTGDGSLTVQSGVAMAVVLIGLGALLISRRRQPA